MSKKKAVVEDVVENVKVEKKAEPEYVIGTVIAKMLAVRPTPSTEQDPLYILYEGDKVECVAVDDDWYSIKTGGFCMAKYIKL